MTRPPFQPALITPARITRRRMGVLTFVVFTTGVASLLMGDLLWGSPIKGWAWFAWALFTVLFLLVAFGAAHAVFGFFVRRRETDDCSILRSLPDPSEEPVSLAPTAIVLPIHNEPADRIFAGIETILRSLDRTGHGEHFHFFILSDSTDPDAWVEEELGWSRLVMQLGLGGRLFYRRRRANPNKKAGNVADFCRRWGRRYRYMIVLDADSIMAGPTLVQLVRLMERNPAVGLIQTAPSLIRAESFLARTLQFAASLYGPVFQAGLNYWQLGEGNYWGHNAIIRLGPFIKHCSLPGLPGREPFGGHILSHDFVEAALLRRAGWGVWLAPELGGSHEELPPTLIDLARRDRRWSQGNLQHIWILFARGLHGISRVHLFLGVFSYASSLLWLTSLVLGTLLAIGFARTGLTFLPEPALANAVGVSATVQYACLTAFTFALLFGPKFLAVLDLRLRAGALSSFGGALRLWTGVFLELVTSALLAPVLMLFHAKFVVATLFGRGVRWGTQRREGATTWAEAFEAHWGHTLVGLAWTGVLAFFAPGLLPWMSPVLLGLVLSIPFSQVTSRTSLGQALARRGLLCTADELTPSQELRELSALLAATESAPPRATGFIAAVLDPRTNALHCALQRERRRQPAPTRARLAELGEKLLREGPAALSAAEKNFLLSDPIAMAQLHRDAWTRPPGLLAAAWREVIAAVPPSAPAAQPAEPALLPAHEGREAAPLPAGTAARAAFQGNSGAPYLPHPADVPAQS